LKVPSLTPSTISQITVSPSQILKNASITSINEHNTLMVDVFSPPSVPDGAPEAFKITYKVHKHAKVTIEEVLDDGSVHHF
jgi:hypothetical protein